MRSSILSFFFAIFLLPLYSSAACEPNELSVIVTIQTDDFGSETGWELKDNQGVIYYQVGFNEYADNQIYETAICVPDDVCLIFTIMDMYGDGIESPGYFEVTIDNQPFVSTTNFTTSYLQEYNCPSRIKLPQCITN